MKPILIICVCIFLLAPLLSGAAEIHTAVISNDLARIDQILTESREEAVNAVLPGNITPLHLAAAMNHADAVSLLIAAGSDINPKTDSGFTPLHWAAGRGAADATALLIQSGADINIATDTGITPLHWASSRNSTNAVKVLMAAGADIEAKTVTGFTPLHWAIMQNASEISILLAYQTVTAEMNAEEPQVDLIQSYVDEAFADKPDSGVPENLPSAAAPRPTTAAPQSALPRPDFGASMEVPIGQGFTIPFVWVESMDMWVGKYEVSNSQYRRFDPLHSSMFYESFTLDGNEQPVVYVSWFQSQEYCNWLNSMFADRIPLNCEFRLPTQAEWETFARCGTERLYPWGNQWPPRYGNLSDLTARRNLPNWQGISHYDDGFAVTCPVTESGANEWNIYGLAGNVWEWCQDWLNDNNMQFKVRRGGSWDFDEQSSLYVTAQGFDRPDARYDTIGFRVVISPIAEQ